MRTDEVHREPFLHLVDLAADRALIGWGAFWFVQRAGDDRRWQIVDDEDLPSVAGRSTCIGHEAESLGTATVELRTADGTLAASESTDRCWAWVEGLEPDTEYTYRVLVDGEEWAAGERWDWVADPDGGYDLAPAGRAYDPRFRTFPADDADTPPVRFVALGDFGVGTRSDSESSRRQRRVAEVLDRLVETHDVRFVVSLGDTVYQGEEGEVDDESGSEDDDWYSSFFEPYRYALARIPFFPAIGNHDTSDTEGSDDRSQMEDNFHIHSRFRHPGRSYVDPGLFYRFRFGRDLELVAIDTSEFTESEAHRHFQEETQRAWLEESFPGPDVRWRIPFSHHPSYCAGPHHGDDEEMLELLEPMYDRAGVRLVLAGHEHNFQIGECGGRTYVVSGSGGKIREDRPHRLGQRGVSAWSAQAHLLLVEIDGEHAQLTPVSGLLADGRPHPMSALTADNQVRRPPFLVG